MAVEYRPGTFLSADLDKASEDNERNAVLLETADGARVGVVQIAGLLARRIVCDVAAGDEVAAGETYGLIRFGSRVDVYLPPGSRVLSTPGQRTIGGETVLAELPGVGLTPGESCCPPGCGCCPTRSRCSRCARGCRRCTSRSGGRFELCVAAVGVAALCDALDGRLARLLDATSRIGAELDSLSDLVSFGVAPALVLYIWALQGTRLGWVVALVFAVCMALRLARFNTLLDDTDQPPYAKEFFVGVPAPAGGAARRAAAVRDAALRATAGGPRRCRWGCGRWSSPG